jgi:hypothetical protein
MRKVLRLVQRRNFALFSVGTTKLTNGKAKVGLIVGNEPELNPSANSMASRALLKMGVHDFCVSLSKSAENILIWR